MIAILICLFLVFLGGWIGWRAGNEIETSPFSAFIGTLVASLAISLLFLPLAGMTGGLLEGYSEGERTGYLTKTSVEGVFWKTNEIQIQVGTGEMSALQGPHPFSVPDEALFEELRSRLGERVTLQYEQWIIMPFHLGESGYEVTGVEWEGSAKKVERLP